MCNENHTTLLHPVTLWPDKKNCASEHNVQTNNDLICSVNISNALNSNDNEITENVALSNIADSGVKNVFMPIVLVKAKSPVSNIACVTYGLIDSGSDATFCSENLLHKLNIVGDKTRLKLTTLQNANHVVDSQLVQNLRVSDVDNNYEIVILDSFSRPQLNIEPNLIFPILLFSHFVSLFPFWSDLNDFFWLYSGLLSDLTFLNFSPKKEV